MVREASGSDLAAAHEAVGDMMWGEYERSFGKDGFAHFMAFDGARPVAIGALAVFEGLGYLTAATTAESDRNRGAQSALIAARIAKARELGCTGTGGRNDDDARALAAQSRTGGLPRGL